MKHGLLVNRLRLEGPSAALDLGLAQLRVFERDHIVAEAVFLAVRARLNSRASEGEQRLSQSKRWTVQ